MRKPIRSTLEDLIDENKKELMSDPAAISKIEKKLDERKAQEVYVEEIEDHKQNVFKYASK